MNRGRLFVIGDIHGCLEQLEKLLAIIDPKIKHEDDKIVFLGDYIDRGPDSKGVVDLLISRDKADPGRHVFIKGNHEDMMLEFNLGNWMYNGGNETLKSYGYDPAEHGYPLDCISAEHKQFYAATELYYHRGRTVCVHAGIDPTIKLADQSEHDCLWTRRFVGYDGDYQDNAFVVYGHTPNTLVTQKRNQLGIDTACVFGGALTCAVIDDESGNVDEIYKVHSESIDELTW